MAEHDAIEKKQKEVEAKFNPIMMRVYQAAGGAPGGMPDMGGMGGAGAPPTGGAGAADDLD
jgi:L1 cell adhesion molecule like protein